MADEAPGGADTRTGSRIDAVDLARGLALVAMAVYHFTWDLEFFGYAEPGLSQQGGWKLFARSIASSFLFLVGISLVLAHGRGVRWAGFRRRLFQVAAAAAVITIATWYATPDRFIFFGILHQIAFASVVGLAFLRLPALLTLLAAALVLNIGVSLHIEMFAHPTLSWLGLSPVPPLSNDFVPVFPWTAAVLAGIGVGRLLRDRGVFARLSKFHAGNWAGPLRFCGRHSLAFYLLHQPVLIACIWSFAQFWPAAAQTPEFGFMRACEESCVAGPGNVDCPRYCACVLDGIDAAGRLDDVFAGVSDAALQTQLNEIASGCRQSGDN